MLAYIPESSPWLSTREAMAYAKCSEKSLYRACAAKDFDMLAWAARSGSAAIT